MMQRFAAAAAVVATATVCSASLTSTGLTSTSAALAAPRMTAAARTAVAASGHWWNAEEVPGTAAVNHGNDYLPALSCASAGNCSAGGSYAGRGGYGQPYVVGETKGVWGKAVKVTGFATLNAQRGAGVDSMSCASAGNCTASGVYTDSSDNTQVFVVGETNGTWGKAEELPGLAALNQSGDAEGGVVCGSAGNCSIAGRYQDSSFRYQAFVATETNGTWGKAEEVPGTGALNRGGDAGVGSMSCPSAGNCIAVGSYSDISTNDHEFAVTETHGTWGKAEKFPGLAALDSEGSPELSDISCASVGNCTAGGSYIALDQNKGREVFVTTETNGIWGKAEQVPGTAALNSDGAAYLASVSCASVGNCSAGGFYSAGVCGTGGCMGYDYPLWPFVVTETNGTWGTAEELPGIVALNKGKRAELTSISCAAAGDCSVSGVYADGSSEYCCAQTFVATQTRGAWARSEEIPGTAVLNHGDTNVELSCGAPGNCTAGGDYTDSSGHRQAFVARESRSRVSTGEPPDTASTVPGQHGP